MATSGTLAAANPRAGTGPLTAERAAHESSVVRGAIEVRALVRELPAAWTPDRVASVLERFPRAVFFESAGADLEAGAWTLFAFDPIWQVEVRDGRLLRDGVDLGPALQALTAIWPESVEYATAPPIPFATGLAGSLAYDLKNCFERYPSRALAEWDHPDLCLGFHDVVFGWRRDTGAGWVVATGLDGSSVDPARATARLNAAWASLEAAFAAVPEGAEAAVEKTDVSSRGSLAPTAVSDFTREDYLRAVERAKEHIAAGDIYQVNLSQRFRVEPAPPPAALYRRLRAVAPAPFLAYVALPGGDGIASSSPERFFSVRASTIESRPIKGTRPRGSSPAEDAAMADALRSSEKDRAENLMIVDLVRNDLGRVCRVGSVRVPALWEVETHSNVHQLVSRVAGTLREDATPIDILQALFPGGSITGAPKIRAVEIIDELEPVRRGVYTGAIGYWDASGDADWNIAIRTITVGGGVASFHVGGGVVADSTPEGEYEETLVKATGMMRALGVSREG